MSPRNLHISVGWSALLIRVLTLFEALVVSQDASFRALLIALSRSGQAASATPVTSRITLYNNIVYGACNLNTTGIS